MRARVEGFHSPDVYDLDSYRPEAAEDVGVFIQIYVGSDDGPGEDSFDLEVVTPRHLLRHVQESGPIIGRGYVIVAEWDWPKIREFLTSSFEREQAPTWQELAQRLGRIGHWEFEDYRPSSDEPPG